MKVGIKKLAVDMPVKNKGIELEVRDTDGTHLGDLIVSKAGLTGVPDEPVARTESACPGVGSSIS